jgi:hypothetical protein
MKSRLSSALIAGSAAMFVSTFALKSVHLGPLATAEDGLLQLMSSWFSPLLGQIGIVNLWLQMGLPSAASTLFQSCFHLVVGLLMAIFYAYLVEPRLPMTDDIVKGITYALGVWLLNAFVILPLICDDISGIAGMTLAGIFWCAAAHSVFFVLLALFYGALRRHPSHGSALLSRAVAGDPSPRRLRCRSQAHDL